MKKKNVRALFILCAVALTIVIFLTGFHTPQQPVSAPANDDPKVLMESSEWEEQDGEQTFVYHTETYMYE